MKKQLFFFSLSAATIIGLSGCGNDTNHVDHSKSSKESKQQEMKHNKSGSMKNMDMKHGHSGSGEVPENLKAAENPTYKIGSQAMIKADHMKGMMGAQATIVGAYTTTAYVVSYTPTTGGERVENHKWVIQEEIKNAGNQTIKPGTEVTIEADHMKGMKGAKAEIVSSEKTTVYMIDYTPTTGGAKVKNHKWVTESELSAK
ncbi:YdhK family protein [Neobacillus sp. PS3-34]|uniref:YdhK family protein n=1 Tax=Neobacillus sp. PS3-34 TaxID=3070678 RepID=UPI0027DEE082|nr:YdhK family protein [Neobacillus sp. PS3-34]WML46936.1 YdhK family protein [Neobacillus sp. PS3-34]